MIVGVIETCSINVNVTNDILTQPFLMLVFLMFLLLVQLQTNPVILNAIIKLSVIDLIFDPLISFDEVLDEGYSVKRWQSKGHSLV